MVLLDLVDASWFPLAMVIGIGAVMYLLYLSMRREIRKIRVPQQPASGADDDAAAR